MVTMKAKQVLDAQVICLMLKGILKKRNTSVMCEADYANGGTLPLYSIRRVESTAREILKKVKQESISIYFTPGNGVRFTAEILHDILFYRRETVSISLIKNPANVEHWQPVKKDIDQGISVLLVVSKEQADLVCEKDIILRHCDCFGEVSVSLGP